MSRREHTGVWKAGPGRYGVDYRTPDGGRVRKIIGPEKLAIRYYQARMSEIFENRYRPAPPMVTMTYAELAAESLKSKRGRIRPRSYDSEVGRGKLLREKLGPVLINTITPAMIDALLSELSRQGKAGATINRYRSVLSSAFTYAVNMELLTKNPVRRVHKYPEPKCRKRVLAEDEERALRQAVRENYPEREAELILLKHTGLRKGEMFALRWQDVDLVRGQITVQDSDYAKTGFNVIDLNSVAVAALRELYANSNGRAKVCHSTGYSRSMDWFRECVQIAGIEDFTPHDLRHTFGSRAVERGVPLEDVQEWMGHRSILTTRNHYVHLSASHKKAQIEKLVDPLDSFEDSSKEGSAEVVELKKVTK